MLLSELDKVPLHDPELIDAVPEELKEQLVGAPFDICHVIVTELPEVIEFELAAIPTKGTGYG